MLPFPIFSSIIRIVLVDTSDDLGFNVLHEAVLGGNPDMIKHLSKGHAAPVKGAKRRKNVNGRTPMHLAAFLAGLYRAKMIISV